MKVTYGRFVTENCPANLARDKRPSDEKDLPSAAPGFRAFAGTLTVEWQARDGSAFVQTIELEKVFKDRRVLHKEDPKQIDPSLPLVVPPLIVVEVNDRTLTISMDVDIGLLADEPGRVRRSSRNQTIAFQQQFN